VWCFVSRCTVGSLGQALRHRNWTGPLRASHNKYLAQSSTLIRPNFDSFPTRRSLFALAFPPLEAPPPSQAEQRHCPRSQPCRSTCSRLPPPSSPPACEPPVSAAAKASSPCRTTGYSTPLSLRRPCRPALSFPPSLPLLLGIHCTVLVSRRWPACPWRRSCRQRRRGLPGFPWQRQRLSRVVRATSAVIVV
jgi:hypothetical protein